MTLTLRPNQRALLLKDGVAQRLLQPGRHFLWFRSRFETVIYDTDQVVTDYSPELEAVLPNTDGFVLVVKPDEAALLTVDGQPFDVLVPGRYVVWTCRKDVVVKTVALDGFTVDIPNEFFVELPEGFWPETVGEHETVLVYKNGTYAGSLESGRHVFYQAFDHFRMERFDLRELELVVAGQEVMTADKVTIRINLIVRYRVVDALLAATSVDNLRNAIYSALQIATRGLVGEQTLDALLESRVRFNDALKTLVEESCGAWGVEVVRADVKDIILPGDMKSILNQVISAQKQAEANVITRREETAATRSLANTAKMLEKNPTLMRLKELEMVQGIASKVDHLTVIAGKDGIAGLLNE